jgi:hypothetical protein
MRNQLDMSKCVEEANLVLVTPSPMGIGLQRERPQGGFSEGKITTLWQDSTNSFIYILINLKSMSNSCKPVCQKSVQPNTQVNWIATWINCQDWKHGSSSKVPALQPWSPEFKPQSYQKKKKLQIFLKNQLSKQLADSFLFIYLQYWGLNSGPTPWATPPAPFCDGCFWDSV